MQISNTYPQFTDNKTLIIVASTQSADLYIAHDGEINNVAEIRTEKVDYDDQAGRFERRAGGKTLGSVGVTKDENRKIKERFHKELKEALDDIDSSEIAQTILLSSPQDKSDTKAQIPNQLIQTLVLEIDGNYVGEHPDDILEKIKEADSHQ